MRAVLCACRVARQVAVQQSKFVATSSAAKLRTQQEEELRAMVAEQERRASEFEKLFDLVRLCRLRGMPRNRWLC